MSYIKKTAIAVGLLAIGSLGLLAYLDVKSRRPLEREIRRSIEEPKQTEFKRSSDNSLALLNNNLEEQVIKNHLTGLSRNGPSFYL